MRKNTSSIEISVVCPVYGCHNGLQNLYERLKNTLSRITDKFEIILVNDACPQNSWESIMQLAVFDSRVKGVNFSRNFGQHYAITAGLDHAKGQWIVVMDCDLQDQPEEIINFYAKAKEGYDIVIGKRHNRQDSYFKRVSSKVFYAILSYLTDTKYDATIANFGIYSYKVIQSVNLYRERCRAFPLLVNMVGFKKIAIPIAHANRENGQSSYTFKKALHLAFDCIIAYSNKPLRLFIQFGGYLSFFSLCYAIWLILRYFLYEIPIPGWTSMMVVLFFMFGLLFGGLGILGIYIGKIFDEIKSRPLYLAQEKINFEDVD